MEGVSWQAALVKESGVEDRKVSIDRRRELAPKWTEHLERPNCILVALIQHGIM
jgi:hypothetical protein